jgi:hypothetical protein
LVLWKSLESSCGTNSRFGLGLGSLEKKLLAICFKHLDDCTCSEKSLAPTIIIPIRLNATLLMHIVHWMKSKRESQGAVSSTLVSGLEQYDNIILGKGTELCNHFRSEDQSKANYRQKLMGIRSFVIKKLFKSF